MSEFAGDELSVFASAPAAEEAPAAVEPEPVAPAEPQWVGPSQEEWQQVHGQYQEIQNALTEAQQQQALYEQQQQAEYEGEETDPEDLLTRAEAQALMQQEFQRFEQQRLSPISEYVDRSLRNEGMEQAKDVIASLQAEKGELVLPDATDRLIAEARNILPQMEQKFGAQSQRAAEAALEAAYERERDYQNAVGKAYYERQNNQLSTLANARREPGAMNQAGQSFVIPEGGDELGVAQRHFGNLGPYVASGSGN